MANGVSNSKLRTQRLDRAATAVKVATSSFAGTSNAVGDITAGEVVTVTLVAGTASQPVGNRKTGAIFLGWSAVPVGTTGTIYWSLTQGSGGSVLDIIGPGGSTDTLSFWVF